MFYIILIENITLNSLPIEEKRKNVLGSVSKLHTYTSNLSEEKEDKKQELTNHLSYSKSIEQEQNRIDEKVLDPREKRKS